MMKRKWMRISLLLLLAGATAMAFLAEIPVQYLEDETVTDVYHRIARMLEALSYALPENPPLLMLLTGALAWLYRRFLLTGRAKAGEYVIASMLAAAMLLSQATKLAGAVSVLWVNTTQGIKAVLIWGGLIPFWVAVIRVVDWGINWLCSQKTAAFRRPLLTPMLLMLLVWLPQALIRYPGAVVYDTVHQLHEFFGDLAFTAMNPPAHTVLLGAFVSLGDWLGCAHFGLFLVTALQMVSMAWILAWFLNILQRLKMPAPLIWGLLGIYLFIPTYSAYLTTILKDSACSIATTLLMIQTALLVIRPDIFWEHKGRGLVLWIVSGVFTILMRKNGIGMAAPVMIAAGLYALMQSGMQKAAMKWLPLISGVMVIVITHSALAWITAQYDVGGGNVREVLSIPFQQTARVLREQEVPGEEVELINQVLDAELIAEVYEPDISDKVKNTFREDATAEDLMAYAKVWMKHLVQYPSSNMDALFGMIHSIFTPSAVRDNFYDFVITDPIHHGKWSMEDWQSASPLSVLRQPLNWLYHFSLGLPVLSLLTNLGAHVVLVIILGYLALKNRKLWIVWLLVLMCLALLLFSPLTCTRYALPVFWCTPVLVAVVCHERKYGERL